jgi:hypothetical protein
VLSYQFLDKVADSYTPLLGVTWLVLVVQSTISRRRRQAVWRLVFGLFSLLVAYSFMWADNAFLLWPSVGLDYSTHSAVALALATAIGTSSRWLRLPVAVTLLAYFLLMLYQRYHTVADIASTSAAVAVPLAALAYIFSGRVEAANSFKPKPLCGST